MGRRARTVESQLLERPRELAGVDQAVGCEAAQAAFHLPGDPLAFFAVKPRDGDAIAGTGFGEGAASHVRTGTGGEFSELSQILRKRLTSPETGQNGKSDSESNGTMHPMAPARRQAKRISIV
jgi:hypothetical protein